LSYIYFKKKKGRRRNPVLGDKIRRNDTSLGRLWWGLQNVKGFD
jgi:hypothetical protein